MKKLVLLAAAVAVAPILSAQDGAAGAPPDKQGQGEAKPQPEVKAEPTPQERIAKIKAEIAKRQTELDHIKSISERGGLLGRVRSTLAERVLTAQSINDPSFKPGEHPASTAGTEDAPKQRKARLLGDAEKEKLAENVIFTVDEQPVSKEEFGKLYDYLKSYPREEGEDSLKMQTVQWLTYLKAAQAAFPDAAKMARTRIGQAKAKLEQGQDFAAVARELSQCPSSAEGGDLGYFGRNAGLDLFYEKAMFTTKVGQVSAVVPSSFGYHLIKVTGKKKAGDSDEIQTSHILAMYSPDQMAVRQIRIKVDSGQSDLAFRSDDYRKFAPPAYK